MLCAAFGLMAVAMVYSSFHRKPRPWPVEKIPVAFWSWRNQTPSDADVRAAIEQTRAHTIFLRAGQIDYQAGKLSRIRPIDGPLPKKIDLHLVYNATRSLLDQLETVDEESVAKAIAESFEADSRRATAEQARVVGLQIDIDFPTRLLRRYKTILRALRARLQPGRQLSITGLPTWMQSTDLPSTLTVVDFWIPQFYGNEIPARADQLIPISAPQEIERFVNQARQLNKPFYAGLAAYGYALLYSPAGSFVSLRGDLDPAVIANDPNLVLVDSRSFPQAMGEWRYAYRARADGVTDGLAMHAGDVLVVNLPSAESLRAAAQIVRELAGEKLLGICVFRLPGHDDPATLAIEQVAAALANQPASPKFSVSFKKDRNRPGAAWLEIENQGTANAIGDLKIDLGVGTATVDSVSAQRGASVETLCRLPEANNQTVFEPCSLRRANLIRIAAPVLRRGQILRAFVVFNTSQASLPVSIQTKTDAGQTYHDQLEIHLQVE